MAALQQEDIPSRRLSAHDQWDRIAGVHGPEYQVWVHPEDASRAEAAIRAALNPDSSGDGES